MDFEPAVSNLLAAFLGLIIGSFLNVVIARLPHGRSILKPRSHCPSCQATIRWYDNIPVLSWLLLRGKCRRCGAEISVRYPLIELMTAVLFLAAKLRFGLSVALITRDFPFLAILVAVTFIDLEHRIIPDELSLGGLVLGLVSTAAFWWFAPGAAESARMVGWGASFIGAALGFALFFGLSWVYLRLTGRSGLGGGDVKLLAMIGAFLGPGGVFATILISSVSGSLVGIGWAWWARRKGITLAAPIDEAEDETGDSLPAGERDALLESPTGRSEPGEAPDLQGPPSLLAAAIPYGPFLVIGALYYYLLSDLLWFPFTIPT